MQVRVYWNLHRACWSVQDARTRRVIGHANQLLIREARFTVSEAGRQRVLRERKKNVHAFVVGELEAAIWSDTKDWREPMAWEIDPKGNNAYRKLANRAGTVVTYNPFKGPYFVETDTFTHVSEAPMAYLTWESRRGRDLTPKARLVVCDPCHPEGLFTRLSIAA